MYRNIFFLFILSFSFPFSSHSQKKFTVGNGQFYLDGKPFRIFSGEMHYPRIPKEYWKDRLLKLKATGLNTVCTYAFWNIHETSPGIWDFSGEKNIAEFIATAQQVG